MPNIAGENWEMSAEVYSELRRSCSKGADRAARFKSIADVTGCNELTLCYDRHRHIARKYFSTPCSTKRAHQKSETQTRSRVRPSREASLRAGPGPRWKFGARSLVDHELALPGYLGTATTSASATLPIARGSAPECSAGSRAGFTRFASRRKRDVAKDLPEKIERSCLAANESSTRRL